jgi:hypothetical protein
MVTARWLVALLCVMHQIWNAGCSGHIDVEWPLNLSVLLERSFTLRVRLHDFEARTYQIRVTLNGSPFLHGAFYYDAREGSLLLHETDIPSGSYVLQVTVEADEAEVASSGELPVA